jgi:type I restriction enzyme S subunit
MRLWDEQPLGDLCILITDGKHGDCRNEDNSGYYFISCKDVKEGRINYENSRQIVQADFAKTHRRTDLKPGDVVLTNSGTIGRLAIAPDDEKTERTTFQKRVAILKPIRDRIHSQFLYYKLAAEKARLINTAGGAAQKNLLLGELRRFPISIPPLEEQARIVSTLSPYDELIENNRRRIQLLEQTARLLYKEWFVHLRFPGHEHVKIIDGVPEGWERKPLGGIVATNVESYKARELPDEINYIDISSVTEGRIITKSAMSSNEAPGRARRRAKSGDVIWSNVRPNLRAYALILEPDENDVFSTGFTVLSPIAVPFSYLYVLVTTDEFVGHLMNHATGVSYPAVRPDDFERAVVQVPSKQILELFNEKTEPMLKLISVLDEETKPLAQARDLFLPRLMNGEISV